MPLLERTVGRVVIVTDSSATVPAKLVRELDIRIVPILLSINGRSYRDGVDITPEQVYRWLRTNRPSPTTSSPSVGDFLRAYAAAAQKVPDPYKDPVSDPVSGIVSIHLSPKLSATYNAAATASQLLDGVPIRVLNCHTVAMGQGFVVLAAARAAAAGANLEEVIARANEVASRMNLLATIDTLEYLHRGGRIGGAAALMGTVLQIKPVLYVSDGYVDVFAKPRTKSKAIRIMLQQMAERVDGRPVHAAILHADVPGEAAALRQKVARQFDWVELYVTELTPVMGTHTGPGVLGVVFYAE